MELALIFLDMISKTCVSEIHLYDKDQFQQHNSFRAPGAASIDDLEKNKQNVITIIKRIVI